MFEAVVRISISSRDNDSCECELRKTTKFQLATVSLHMYLVLVTDI